MSLPLPRYYRILFTVPTVLPWNFSRSRGNYRGYRGITAFPVTASSSNLYTAFVPLRYFGVNGMIYLFFTITSRTLATAVACFMIGLMKNYINSTKLDSDKPTVLATG